MADNSRSISELESITADEIQTDDLLTLVDISESNPDKMNKKIEISEFESYLKEYTNLFPIDINDKYINTTAFIDTGSVEISSKVANQTVNIADIGLLKFDNYGRVYDYEVNSEQTASTDIFIGAGTAAAFYKDQITGNEDTAQPSSYDFSTSNSTIAGYFNSNSYYYPRMNSYTADPSQKVNYSDRQNNDYDWRHLFDKKYNGFNRTTIDIVLGSVLANDGATCKSGRVYIDINWNTGKVTGTGILPAFFNKNVPFTITGTLTGEANELQGTIDNNGASIIAIPKLQINYDLRQITGLPINTPIYNGNFQNIGVPITVTITSFPD